MVINAMFPSAFSFSIDRSPHARACARRLFAQEHSRVGCARRAYKRALQFVSGGERQGRAGVFCDERSRRKVCVNGAVEHRVNRRVYGVRHLLLIARRYQQVFLRGA